ncbi:MAG: formate/nitrite transporter family protein [Thermomicrobiales bacterium]
MDTSGSGATIPEIRMDPYAPAEMATRVENAGISKATGSFLTLATLGVLAGAFISLGAQVATVAGTETGLGYGPTQILVGAAFSVGLILVVIAGAELFTGNTLIVMAWLEHKVSARLLLRNWSIVYVANFAGALGMVALIYWSRQWELAGHEVGARALAIANAKVNLSWGEALSRGILCNLLVNLAVWLCFSARSNVDKIFAIVPVIGTFVASSFEHSIANMYFIPIGMAIKDEQDVLQAGDLTAQSVENLTTRGFLIDNLLPVTIGNIIGGAVMVAAVYWLVYLRSPSRGN